MDLSFTILDRTLFIKVYGAFDYNKSLKLKELLQGTKRQKYANALFDLADISSIDSLGLGVIVAVARQVSRRGGCIRVVNPPRHLRPLLELVRLPGLESRMAVQEQGVRATKGSPLG